MASDDTTACSTPIRCSKNDGFQDNAAKPELVPFAPLGSVSQLVGCLKSLRAGDTLVVWRLDRLGRNLADLVRLIAELEQRKVNFESLTEKIETGSPTGSLIFHVFAALAEFERNLICERTVAGLTAARARGRKVGRPPKLSAKELSAPCSKQPTSRCRDRRPLRHCPFHSLPDHPQVDRLAGATQPRDRF